MSRLPSMTVNVGINSQFQMAAKPNGKLVVFVHGFGGQSFSTWQGFEEMLPSNRSFQDCDYIFFGYDGLTTQAYISACLLRALLKVVVTPAGLESLLPPSTQKLRGFKGYNKIRIVAHSLGAVVTRRALLDLWLERQATPSLPPLSPLDFILFAPAHLGAMNVDLLAASLIESIPLIGGFLNAATRHKYKAIFDLASGSPMLTKLERDTELALARGAGPLVKPIKVVYGDREEVVIAGRFCDDPPAELVEGHDHSSLCRPTAKFGLPFDWIGAGL